jgi:hypothetical protein
MSRSHWSIALGAIVGVLVGAAFFFIPVADEGLLLVRSLLARLVFPGNMVGAAFWLLWGRVEAVPRAIQVPLDLALNGLCYGLAVAGFQARHRWGVRGKAAVWLVAATYPIWILFLYQLVFGWAQHDGRR